VPPRKARPGTLAFLLAYAAASLLHFAHNAEYLKDYPNLPASWTRGDVYMAWLAQSAVGLVGYVLLRAGWQRTGLALVGAYALTGFLGFAHYHVAPAAAHTMAMNAAIWLEAVAGTLLLVAVWREFSGAGRRFPR
jgi:hypothetical protein